MRSTFNEHRYTKLPKWAQIELANLTKRTLAAEADMRRMAGGDEGSNVSILADGEVSHLPMNARVQFKLPDGGTICIAHDYDRKGVCRGVFVVGQLSLMIEPRSGNTCTLNTGSSL